MKISISNFRGEIPLIAPRLLPPGMGTSVVNAKLTSGDFDGFPDIGNPFQLSKDPIINTIWLMKGPAPDFWLQWSQDEVMHGVNIDVSLGTIPGDIYYRTFITGLDVPRETNLWYATDPVNQGSAVAGAYPYITLPLGLENPTAAPTASAPPASANTTVYEYAQEASVNAATPLLDSNAATGTGYAVGQILDVQGGTVFDGLTGAQLKVITVDAAGGITGVSIKAAGFYTAGNGPSSPAAVTGGTGSGAEFTINNVGNSFSGFTPLPGDNFAGSYVEWSIDFERWKDSSGQGDLNLAYSNDSFNLRNCDSWSFQADMIDALTVSDMVPTDLVMYLCGTWNGNSPPGTNIQLIGPAMVLSDIDGTLTLYSDMTGTNGNTVDGTIVQQVSYPFTGDVFYRVSVSCVSNTSGTQQGFNTTVTVALSAAPTIILATVSGFIPYSGEQIGVGTNHRGNHDDGNDGFFRNFLVTVAQPGSAITRESTNYVATYVRQRQLDATHTYTEESGPSDPSNTVTVFIDGSTDPATWGPVTLLIPGVPADSEIAFVNIYREVGTTNPEYEFVAEIPALTTTMTYTDSALDSDLPGGVLETANWGPPPDGLLGILALPNGIMSGFFENTLALSVQNFPHSWPVGNQYTTAPKIVAIAAIDATVFILTQDTPYTAYGNDPADFKMTRETASQGCISKRSVATHKVYGVLYAAANGLAYFKAQGQLDLIRRADVTGIQRPLFDFEQWKALAPETIFGVTHNDLYMFSYDTGSKKAGYMLDLRPEGFGLVELDFHWTAAYVDPVGDKLYLVPDASIYPIGGHVVDTAQNIVYEWEYQESENQRPKSWERDYFLLQRPAAMTTCRVQAETYEGLSLTVSNENGLLFSGEVTDDIPFTLGYVEAGRKYTVAVEGADRINVIEICEAVEEFEQ